MRLSELIAPAAACAAFKPQVVSLFAFVWILSENWPPSDKRKRKKTTTKQEEREKEKKSKAKSKENHVGGAICLC